MVQREVGERILARPGDLNFLAISVAVFGKPRLVSRVPANAFYPQPTSNRSFSASTYESLPFARQPISF